MLNRLLQEFHQAPNNGRQIVAVDGGRLLVTTSAVSGPCDIGIEVASQTGPLAASRLALIGDRGAIPGAGKPGLGNLLVACPRRHAASGLDRNRWDLPRTGCGNRRDPARCLVPCGCRERRRYVRWRSRAVGTATRCGVPTSTDLAPSSHPLRAAGRQAGERHPRRLSRRRLREISAPSQTAGLLRDLSAPFRSTMSLYQVLSQLVHDLRPSA